MGGLGAAGPAPGNGTLAPVPPAAVPGSAPASPGLEEPPSGAGPDLRLAPDPERAPEPDEGEGEADAGVGLDAGAGKVEELFARLRAAAAGPEPTADLTASPEAAAPARADEIDQADDPDPPEPVPAAVTNGSAPAGRHSGTGLADAPDHVADESTRARRDELLEPVEADLVRSVKRVLQDEQNEVLDNLRRQRRPVAAAVLPDAAVQRERYGAVAGPLLQRAVHAGAEFAAGDEDFGLIADNGNDGLVAGLVADLVTPLRQRVERVVEEGVGTEDYDALAVADGVSAAYRQWKMEQVERIAQHAAVAAFAMGALAATPVGAHLRWVVDDDAPCPDCDDNALAGALSRGEAFPTGQIHPPAHVGCRCLLVTAPR